LHDFIHALMENIKAFDQATAFGREPCASPFLTPPDSFEQMESQHFLNLTQIVPGTSIGNPHLFTRTYQRTAFINLFQYLPFPIA
jgi:hypothetical protein